MNDEAEIWKPVVGYEGVYEVSNLGRIRSLERVIIKKSGQVCRIKPFEKKLSSWGTYLFCHFMLNGKNKTITVHRLVSLAFVPNPLNHYSIDHLNGDCQDNRACNLEWCSLSKNTRRQWKLGKAKPPRGENAGSSILNESQVREIRKRHSEGEACTALAPYFGVKPSTIFSVVRRENWRHVA